MKLGFHYHIPAITNNGQILMPGYIGRFLDFLAVHCEELVLFLHTPGDSENPNFDYALQAKNVDLISIGSHTSVPNRVLFSRRFTKSLKEHHHQLDALLIRGPSPLLPAMANASRRTPAILLLVGDNVAGNDSLPQPYWRKKLIRLWAVYNKQQQLSIAKRSLTFVNSHKLYQELEREVPNLVETRTTTLYRSDLYQREDTCQDQSVHLLYTGRMDPAKGLLDMVEAIALLVQQGENVVLDLVGWPAEGSNILEEIKRYSSTLQVADRIVYHGYHAVGPDLFAFYKKADLYLIASQSSFEGFPRTIWEAMAHSLPVIATKFGSIPDFIEGAAELVEPKSPNGLAIAIHTLIHQPNLRMRYIVEGRILVQKNTLEYRSQEMALAIKEYIQTRKLRTV